VGFHRGVTDDLVVSKIRDHAKLLEANPPSYQQLRLLLHRLDPLFQTQDQGLASQLMWSFVYQNISIIKLPLAIVRILVG
jgi:hypothetical protein